MIKIAQQNEFTCFLACMESFFKDAGNDTTQQKIIEDFPIECHQGLWNEGVFDFDSTNRAKLAAKYSLKISEIVEAPEFDSLKSGDFIGAERMKDQNSHHIVRFVEFSGNDKIKVMDPKTGDFDFWSKEEFSRYKCYILNVSK
jgi:hypothetical protein